MKKTLIVIACVFSVAVLVLGIVSFSRVYVYGTAHYPEGTTINGVSCSDLTVDQASAKLTKVWNGKTFEFTNKNGKVLGEIEDFGFTYNITSSLKKVMIQSILNPSVRNAIKDDKNLTVKMTVAGTTKAFNKEVKGLGFVSKNYTVKTKNAYVDMSNTDFKIVKEVYGDNISMKRLKGKILNDIEDGDWKVVYKKSNYYELPTVKSTSSSLTKKQDFCNKYYTQKIKYNMHGTTVTITPGQLEKVIKVDDSGNVTTSRKAAYKLAHSLAYKYDTAYALRKFKTAGGSTIKVSGMGYGYLMDYKYEGKQLYNIIKSGKDTTRTPKYKRTPLFKNDKTITNNYVEIDISDQTLYLFKNGKKKLACSVVTGNVSKSHGTPEGVFYVQGMARNATLRGADYDGTQYESPVSYWMPFDGGIGMHDASWRSSFGGTIYQTSGSHGCVNMPYYGAQKVYNTVSVGWPVVVHQ